MKEKSERPLRLGITPVALIIELGFFAMLGTALLSNQLFGWIMWLARWFDF